MQGLAKNADNKIHKDATLSSIVFAELVMFLEEARYEENIASVFKLVGLVKLNESLLKQLQIETDEKERLLNVYTISEHTTKGCISCLSKSYWNSSSESYRAR